MTTTPNDTATQPNMTQRIADYHVSMTATWVVARPVTQQWDGHEAFTHYRVTVKRGGKRMVCYYSLGPAHASGPALADVLDCLVSDAASGEQTFEEFCSELGYDEDSRAAERTWKACRRTASALARLFTAAELDTLRYETERQ